MYIKGEDDSPTSYTPLLNQLPEKMKFTVISSGRNRQKRTGTLQNNVRKLNAFNAFNNNNSKNYRKWFRC